MLKDMTPICMENTVKTELDFTGTDVFYNQNGEENRLTVEKMNLCDVNHNHAEPSFCAANQNATSCSIPIGAPLVALG